MITDTVQDDDVTTLAVGPYHSSFTSKGALLAETKTVLGQIEAGQTPAQVRAAIIEEDLLDRRTQGNRESVWKEIARRYLSGREPQHIATLARMVSRCPTPTAGDLVLLYEYCQVDALLYDLTAGCTYELYQNARTSMGQVDVNEWLTGQEPAHPEIAAWSGTTRSRVIRSYLATIRDFGLVSGIKQKEFHKLYVPRAAFVYALYHQHGRGISGKALVQSPDWRLFLLSESEVIFMLDEAARGGFVHFRQAGSIYDLRLVYRDLAEVVHVLTE